MKNSIKISKAKKKYQGFGGPATVSKLMDRIPESLIDGVTSDQLAVIMLTVAKAYEDGRASTGAEMIDRNAVYINSIKKIIEYERITEKVPGGTHTYSKKIKDGELVPKFSD